MPIRLCTLRTKDSSQMESQADESPAKSRSLYVFLRQLNGSCISVRGSDGKQTKSWPEDAGDENDRELRETSNFFVKKEHEPIFYEKIEFYITQISTCITQIL